jgi:hypothetical protein
MNAEPRPTSCAARLLDVRGYVLAARYAMRGAEPASAMFMIAVFGLIGICCVPIFIVFDLDSTWQFTTGLRDATGPTVAQMSGQIDNWTQLSIGAVLVGLVGIATTLLPSLFELGFPSIRHPLTTIVLWGCLIFDFVTDWRATWTLVAGWTTQPVIRFVLSIGLNAFFAIFCQAIICVCIAVVASGILNLLGGTQRRAEAIILPQQ